MFFYGSREKKLAKKYYDKLFKEYCIADLSRYKENKVCLIYRRFLFKNSITFYYIITSHIILLKVLNELGCPASMKYHLDHLTSVAMKFTKGPLVKGALWTKAWIV